MRISEGLVIAGAGAALALVTAPPARGVPVSGTVVDNVTGAPVVGASIVGDGGDSAGTTDEAGRWVSDLPVGRVGLTVMADGYYLQPLGARLADSTSPGGIDVTATGPNRFDVRVQPATAPFLGISEARLRWRHEPGRPFGAMVLRIDYAGYAALPQSWPQDELVVRLRDVDGTDVPDSGGTDGTLDAGGQGGAVSAFASGSTTGCGYFDSVKRPLDAERMRVVVSLGSRPAEVLTEPLTVDRSQCVKTRIRLVADRHVETARDAAAFVELLHRARRGIPVGGIVTFRASDGRSMRVRLRRSTRPANFVDLTRLVHRGRNVIAVTAEPAGPPSLESPPPIALTIRVGHAGRRHVADQ